MTVPIGETTPEQKVAIKTKALNAAALTLDEAANLLAMSSLPGCCDLMRRAAMAAREAARL